MNQISSRLIFDNARKAMVRAGQLPKDAVLTQSFLRFEVALASGQTSYKFDTLVNENTQAVNFNTQTKLNLQDAFICSELGFFLAAPSSTTDTKFQLLTYPNETALTTALKNNYYTVYNGQMSLTVNQKTVMTNWDLSRHLLQPNQQQNAVTGSWAANVAPAVLPIDGLNLAENGFYPVEPNLILSGSKKNDLQVALPGSGIATVLANSRLVCIMRGILAQNVTSVN